MRSRKGRGREIEEGRTRSREELREKRKRSDRPAVEKTGWWVMYRYYSWSWSWSLVSPGSPHVEKPCSCCCSCCVKDWRGGMTKSQAIVNTFSVGDWCSGGK